MADVICPSLQCSLLASELEIRQPLIGTKVIGRMCMFYVESFIEINTGHQTDLATGGNSHYLLIRVIVQHPSHKVPCYPDFRWCCWNCDWPGKDIPIGSFLMVSPLGGGSGLESFLQHACHSCNVSLVYHTLCDSKLGLQHAATRQAVVAEGWTVCLASDCDSRGRRFGAAEPYRQPPTLSSRLSS